MINLNLNQISSSSLFEEFKKHIGKYIYFQYANHPIQVWLIRDVKIIDGEAKVKMDWYDYDTKKQEKSGRFQLIRNLANEWVVCDEKELNKVLILQEL
jgi:hypothetical protein